VQVMAEDGQQATGRISNLLAHKQHMIGHFLQNKRMIFDPRQDFLMPEAGDPSKAPTLVDISVLKKAGVYSTKNHSNNNNGYDSVRGIQNVSYTNGANHRSPKNHDIN
jgi:hypothetical protein